MKWLIVVLTLLFQPILQIEAVDPNSRAFQELLEFVEIPTGLSSVELVAITQQCWLQKGKERWEYDMRHENLKERLWPLFDQMGLLQEISPLKSQYDYAFVQGALLSRVEARVNYLTFLWNEGIRFDEIVFLTGARPLLDSEKERIPGAATERDMVEWVYHRSNLPKDVPVIFINASMKQREDGTRARPQTIDTVTCWLKMDPKEGSCLAISNQPYISHMDAVLRRLIPKSFEIESVGPAVIGSPSVAIILDTIARELYERNFVPRI
ncbi:MAG: hypothetical protein V4487_00875 [Chlamydiota bacterium]